MTDCTSDLQAAVLAAYAAGSPLDIRGGDSKAFYGGERLGAPLNVGLHAGVMAYEPSELVLTARAGTPLREIETLLAQEVGRGDAEQAGAEDDHFHG